MNKFVKIYFISIFSLLFTISFASCSDEAVSTSRRVSTVKPKTEAGKTFQKFMVATLDMTEKATEVLSQYGIGTDGKISVMSPVSDKSIDLSELMPELGDLSKIKRKKTVETIEGNVRILSEKEISLEDELNMIEDEFSLALEEIKPDTTLATTLDFVERIDNDTIAIGGDMILSANTMSGAIAIELLNAQARGENIDKAMEDMGLIANAVGEDEMEQEGNISAQGTFQDDTSRWDYNKIYYKTSFGIYSDQEQAIKDAMKEWETYTDNAITFLPCKHSATSIVSILYGSSCVNIRFGDTGDALGQSNVGYQPASTGKILFNTKRYIKSANLDELSTTARHELGHIIGLQHEHQRPDRDDYIQLIGNNDIIKNDANFKKLDDKKSYIYSAIKWKTKLVNFGLFKIKMSVPEFYIERRDKQINMRTDYDYFSIMHYENGARGINIKTSANSSSLPRAIRCTRFYYDNNKLFNSEYCIYRNSEVITGNIFITEKDASAVKKMYRGSW